MLDLLLSLWPLFVAIPLPFVAQGLVEIATTRTWHRLDRAQPDDLPLPAGAWVACRLRALQSPYVVLASDRARSDECDVARRHIVLRGSTYFKADPTFWARAAQLLGRSRLDHEHRSWRWLTRAASRAGYLAALGGTGCAVGGVLYGIPALRDAAFYAFIAVVAVGALTLVGSVLASRIAMSELRAAGLEAPRLRVARVALTAAFLPHLAAWVARLALLAWWRFSALDLSHSPMELTALGRGVAAVASVILVLRALAILAALVVPRLARAVSRRFFVAVVLFYLTELAPAVFVYLVWDTAAITAAPWPAVLAFATITSWILLGLNAPIGVPLAALVERLRRTAGEVDPTPAYRAARAQGAEILAAGEAARRARPVWPGPAAFAVRLLAVPLVIAFWLA